jgi:uncharacterized C2H2 Zn-finger protein
MMSYEAKYTLKEPAVDEEGRLLCPKCGRPFDTRKGLNTHAARTHRRHTRPLTTPIRRYGDR